MRFRIIKLITEAPVCCNGCLVEQKTSWEIMMDLKTYSSLLFIIKVPRYLRVKPLTKEYYLEIFIYRDLSWMLIWLGCGVLSYVFSDVLLM